MNDRTLYRAIHQGANTVPIDPAARSKRIRDNVQLAPDEIELALEMARAARIEQDIRDYAHREASCKQQF